MKKVLISLSVLVTSLTVMSAQAANDTTGCEAKKQEIQQELSMAREQGNKARIAGLEKALRENSEHCTDSGLLKARQEKVAEKQQKVQEREQSLREAQADGRHEKIEKQQRKLDDARDELNRAKAMLAK
ncbi:MULTISPECIES: DUF1090 domain-containing protein [Pantoea]|uniref:DUF1090 domain-containing protein n=2 Tax=Pantoea TaxID=53335 RepID=A0A0U3UE58_9GAMM|nr:MULTISPECIES: DUF1090 domain-containing protein [Pantoea]ALV93583.1 hypothetical protein LK04_16150 [Pantoea vagans]KHJ69942.1 hypothetical protein QU24_01510 [Pantoea rodasii]